MENRIYAYAQISARQSLHRDFGVTLSHCLQLSTIHDAPDYRRIT